MLSFAYRFSIRMRIAFVLIPALLGLFYFAASGVAERWSVAGEMRDVQGLAEVTVAASALMHELQLERGMTGGFVTSNGQEFGDPLRRQRHETERRLGDLRGLLVGGHGDLLADSTERSLGTALSRLERLHDHRRNVDRLSITAESATEYYTEVNRNLIGAIADMPRHTSEASLVLQMTAYASLARMKEYAGQERALLTGVFTRGAFIGEEFDRFSTIAAHQQMLLGDFLRITSERLRTRYREVASDPAMTETERLRRVAFERAGQGGFDVDGRYWFEQQTRRIDLLETLEDAASDALIAFASMLRQEAQSALIGYVVLALLLLGGTTALGAFVSRTITGPLGSALRALEDIASGEGDLTRRLVVDGNDEIAGLSEAFNRFAGKIERMIIRIRQATEQIGAASGQIAAGNADLSQRTEEQASSLEEAAASMEEMTATVTETAKNAQEADKLAVRASTQAEEGGAVVDQAVSAMDAIDQASGEISSIILVIEEIAFQTNLLALNAAVEAARAGEQGRGFAVVAGEVRSLARKSSEAAKDIKVLIEDSTEKVGQGSDLVRASGKTLHSIVEEVKRVSTIVSEIATASEEQSAGIQQVNTAVTQMDEVTQQNAALVEEASSAGRSLNDQALALTQLVRGFRVSESSDDESGGGVTLTPSHRVEAATSGAGAGSAMSTDRSLAA